MIQPDEMLDGSSLKRRHNVETVSSSVFDKLTDELLIEILIRLPQKPANICKCISVRFRSLISSWYFVRCYLNQHHKINDSFALYYHPDPLDITTSPSPLGIDMAFGSPIFESAGFSLSFLWCEEEKKGRIRYMASNNGLMLCYATLGCPIVYFVCNPLTKQWISLPPPPTTDVKTPYVGFICNPQYSCIEGKTSFKVVQIEMADGKSLPNTLKLEIFCSVTGRWTKEYYTTSSTPSHEFHYYRWYRSAVVCGGLLYWVALLKRGIFTFDPCNGKCTTIEFPCELGKTRPSNYCLGESGGGLGFCYVSKDGKSYQMWELNKDYNINGTAGEWLLLHKVHLDDMNSTFYRLNKGNVGLLSPHPLNQDIIFFWCARSCRIVEYNMKNKLLKLPCFLRDVKNMVHWYHKFFPFVLPCWPTTIPLIQQHRLN